MGMMFPPPRLRSTKNNHVAEMIEEELVQIRKWALGNEKDAAKDRRNFWMLKIPAIICGIGASTLEAFNVGWAVIVVGFITSICVAIDGLHPRGRLYNVHKRATNELFGLHERLISKWYQLRLLNDETDGNEESNNNKFREDSAALLANIQKEKDRISQYITAAEAGLE